MTIAMDGIPTFSLILLAGGIGTRMKSAIPKQYLPLCHQPLALHSFDTFASLPEVQHFVVVCEPQYEQLFREHGKEKNLNLTFALPGPRRQDSVFNGIQQLRGNPLVCIHDSARPLIETSMIRQVVHAASNCDAAVVGVKVRSTIKICDKNQLVVETPDRATLWEVQTPQVIRLSLLKEGFLQTHKHQLTVTDDVSLVELLGQPVQVVEGSYANIKVTTPEDLALAEQLMNLSLR